VGARQAADTQYIFFWLKSLWLFSTLISLPPKFRVPGKIKWWSSYSEVGLSLKRKMERLLPRKGIYMLVNQTKQSTTIPEMQRIPGYWLHRAKLSISEPKTTTFLNP
jgi:hypothetical protein